MTETIMTISFYMFLSACLGFVIGWVCGEQVARRQNAEEMVEDLHQRLEEARSESLTPERQLKEIRGVLNDVHKHILVVSKGLRKPTP